MTTHLELYFTTSYKIYIASNGVAYDIHVLSSISWASYFPSIHNVYNLDVLIKYLKYDRNTYTYLAPSSVDMYMSFMSLYDMRTRRLHLNKNQFKMEIR